ncbi:ParB/RepB/Spo0J family partition protein [Kocuria sp. M1R5S2]|uniref:ParB/RepB/Spo0J family partition protein n=1 Tax=Kocuria rhizosphaerae TaxID=3376285 RepID=UPI0037AD6F56
MGEALRNTTLVSRPSDMFFVPSAESGDGTGGDAAGQEATTGSVADVEPERSADSAEAPTADVSRETPGRPGESAVGRQPRPPQDVAGGRARGGRTAGARAASGSVPEIRGSEEVSRETAEQEDPELAELGVVPGARFAELPVAAIHPNRKQPRQVFDEEELAELAYSIGELGVLQPIVVRPSKEDGDPSYELVMGERRWRAAQRAGMETIPAIVRETSDDDLLRDALLENLHRSQLNPLEEAAAYQQLMEEFGATQEELSRRIGRSRPQISNTIRLLRLPPLVQRRVAAGVLSSGHARALLSLSDPASMERLAQRIVAEGLSVRATEEAVSMAEGAERKPRRAAEPSRHQDRLDDIADAFADRLDTSVKISLGARKGKMTIEFASVDDLNRIIDVLNPGAERS